MLAAAGRPGRLLFFFGVDRRGSTGQSQETGHELVRHAAEVLMDLKFEIGKAFGMSAELAEPFRVLVAELPGGLLDHGGGRSNVGTRLRRCANVHEAAQNPSKGLRGRLG